MKIILTSCAYIDNICKSHSECATNNGDRGNAAVNVDDVYNSDDISTLNCNSLRTGLCLFFYPHHPP